MKMLVPVTGMTIDVPDEETARLYQTRGFAVPADPVDEQKTQRKQRTPRKTTKKDE